MHLCPPTHLMPLWSLLLLGGRCIGAAEKHGEHAAHLIASIRQDFLHTDIPLQIPQEKNSMRFQVEARGLGLRMEPWGELPDLDCCTADFGMRGREPMEEVLLLTPKRGGKHDKTPMGRRSGHAVTMWAIRKRDIGR